MSSSAGRQGAARLSHPHILGFSRSRNDLNTQHPSIVPVRNLIWPRNGAALPIRAFTTLRRHHRAKPAIGLLPRANGPTKGLLCRREHPLLGTDQLRRQSICESRICGVTTTPAGAPGPEDPRPRRPDSRSLARRPSSYGRRERHRSRTAPRTAACEAEPLQNLFFLPHRRRESMRPRTRAPPKDAPAPMEGSVPARRPRNTTKSGSAPTTAGQPALRAHL